jgi:hypothetical protein
MKIDIHGYQPYALASTVYVIVSAAVAMGAITAVHGTSAPYTYDVVVNGTTYTLPANQIYTTIGQAQIALQLQTSPTPTMTSSLTPTPTKTAKVTPTPSMTASYAGPQSGPNEFSSVSFTATGGTVATSGDTMTFTSNGTGAATNITTNLTGIVPYKYYDFYLRYEQGTCRNAFIKMTCGGNVGAFNFLFGDAIIQKETDSIVVIKLNDSGTLKFSFQTTESTSILFEMDFFDDAAQDTALAINKHFDLKGLSLTETLPLLSLTPTPSATLTPTPSETPEPSFTPTPSHTSTVTPTPSVTVSHTAGASPTPTPSVTVTPTPSMEWQSNSLL